MSNILLPVSQTKNQRATDGVEPSSFKDEESKAQRRGNWERAGRKGGLGRTLTPGLLLMPRLPVPLPVAGMACSAPSGTAVSGGSPVL